MTTTSTRSLTPCLVAAMMLLAASVAPPALALLQAPPQAVWRTADGSVSVTGGPAAIVPIFFASDLTVSYPDFGTCQVDADCGVGHCSSTTNLCEFLASDLVMQAINSSWAAVANVSFQRVEGRPDTGPSVGVSLTGSSYTTGGRSLIGPQLPSGVTDVWLVPCDPTSGPTVGCDRGFEGFRWSIIHEFGHVLGFNHEHQRTDTPSWIASWCADATAAARAAHPDQGAFVPNGVWLTPSYDQDSIMNYCRDQNNDLRADALQLSEIQEDVLSWGDIEGVRKLYGTRNALAANSLYLMSGMPPGSATPFSLFRADPVLFTRRNPIANRNWTGATAMTSLNQFLYVIRGGRLYRVLPSNGLPRILGGVSWGEARLMTGMGESLYIINEGRLWQVSNLTTGAFHAVGDRDWSGATAMTNLDGFLYIVQNGNLHRVNPNNDIDYREIWIDGYRGGFTGPKTMVGVSGTGARDNRLLIADEFHEVVEVDITGVILRRISLTGPEVPITSMVVLNHDVFVAKGSEVYQIDSATLAWGHAGNFWYDVPLITAIH